MLLALHVDGGRERSAEGKGEELIVTCPMCNALVPEIYLGSGGACFDCRLASFVPPWYPKAEKYVYVEAYGHSNATRKPAMGIEWLDAGRIRICDAMMCARKPQRR